MNSTKLTSLLLLLLFTISANRLISAQTAAFNALSQNLTIVYNALERIQLNKYGNLVEDVLLVSDPHPSFNDSRLASVTFYLNNAKESEAGKFYPNERTTLLETLKQMPSSTLNLISKPTICFKNVYDGSYLATYIDTDTNALRIVTSNYYTEKHNIMWSVSGDKIKLQLTIANEAFVAPSFSNYMYIHIYNRWDKSTDLHIDIGLSGKDKDRQSLWLVHPKGDIVSIENSVTEQFICSSTIDFAFNYRYAKGVEGPIDVNGAICQWNVIECNYKQF